MTYDNFEQILLTYLNRRPFQVFTVELHGGQRFEVDGPNTVVYRDGVAYYLAPGKIAVYFDHESVNTLILAPANTDLTGGQP